MMINAIASNTWPYNYCWLIELSKKFNLDLIEKIFIMKMNDISLYKDVDIELSVNNDYIIVSNKKYGISLDGFYECYHIDKKRHGEDKTSKVVFFHWMDEKLL